MYSELTTDEKFELLLGKIELLNERFTKMGQITKDNYLKLLSLVERALTINPNQSGAQDQLTSLRTEYMDYKSTHDWQDDQDVVAQSDRVFAAAATALPQPFNTGDVTTPPATNATPAQSPSTDNIPASAPNNTSSTDTPAAPDSTTTVDQNVTPASPVVTTTDNTNETSPNADVTVDSNQQPVSELADGSQLMADGTRVFPDGSKVLPDGTRVG